MSLDASSPEVLVCPPAQLLFPMAKAVDGSGIQLGAQDAHEAAYGAYTGEISVSMIADTGASYVIIGHSERRHILGEAPSRLASKVQAVLRDGLKCIYCVGETLDQRETDQTQAVILGQIRDAINADIDADRLVVAYEPVWAIGTGKTATPEQAQEVHGIIRKELESIYGVDAAAKIRILYGGSVKPGNAGDLLVKPDIDGALVGGASLVAGDFLAIIRAATSVAH
jgi:triosephosphate isomerase